MAEHTGEYRRKYGDAIEQVLGIAATIYDNAAIRDAYDPEARVLHTAVCLLCRSINQGAAIRLLIENSFIVEARTITRCCYENLFWLSGIRRQGEGFLAQMAGHDAANRLKLSNDLKAFSTRRGGDPDLLKRLDGLMQRLKATDRGDIGFWEEASRAGLQDAYIVYRLLSGDAAHPTATSVSRHLRENEDGTQTIVGEGDWSDEYEDLDTLRLANDVLLQVCIISAEILKLDSSDMLRKHYDHTLALNREFHARTTPSGVVEHLRTKERSRMARKKVAAKKKVAAPKKLTRTPWNTASLAALKKHSKAKTPVDVIAKEMKRTVGALRQKALNLGLGLGHRR